MNIRLSICVAFAVLLLTACGKSNGPGGVSSDSYVDAVSTIADSAPDDSEPMEVESFNPSLPEDSEPQVIS